MCARVMAHLFSDIRNLEWQTLYSNMTLIAQPRRNTFDHASHTRLLNDPNRRRECNGVKHRNKRIECGVEKFRILLNIWDLA